MPSVCSRLPIETEVQELRLPVKQAERKPGREEVLDSLTDEEVCIYFGEVESGTRESTAYPIGEKFAYAKSLGVTERPKPASARRLKNRPLLSEPYWVLCFSRSEGARCMSNQLKVAKVLSIQALRAQGWSQRRIARELGIHRETVARYLGESSKPATAPTGSKKNGKPQNRPKRPPGSLPNN